MSKIFSFFSLIIFSTLISSCKNHELNSRKITFIFDFDQTLYKHEKDKAYPYFIGLSYFGEEKMEKIYPEIMEYFSNIIRIEKYETSSVLKIFKKFDIYPAKKDIDFTISSIKKNKTKGIDHIIKNIKDRGHQVIIIGGGAFGCAVIPEFVKDFRIKKSEIYSGYFKNFSRKSIYEVLNSNHKYFNCGNLKLNTPISKKKSELILFLKNNKLIKNNFIVHIGDERNDLEVWNAKVVDLFIGFGLNNPVAEVKKKAPIFVENFDEFENAINKIINERR